jgi:vitamin B12 transporter
MAFGQDSGTDPLIVRESVLVTANLAPTESEAVGSSVTVVTRAEIQARGTTSLPELLRTVPGVEIVQGGGPGSAASVFLRGSNSSHTLVLVDGIRINTPTTGAVDLADLRVDQVERIEVLRGPQSSLYGSEAMGGVISILTRRGAPGLRADASTEVGSLGLWRSSAGAGGGGERFDWYVSAGRERLDGVSVASERSGNREKDPYTNSRGAAQIGLRLGEASRLQATWRALDATADLDGFEFGVGPTDDPNFRQNRRAQVGSVALEAPVTPWWHQTVLVGVSDEKLEGRDPDTEYNRYDIANRTSDVLARADLRLGRLQVLSVGASFERRTGDVRGGFDARADVAAAFVDSQWTWGDAGALTAAVRRDDHSVFGAHTTYRVTGVRRLGEAGPRLHASWGTGFKAPTFNDLYYPYYGNPGLRPEESRGWDAGLAWEGAAHGASADLTYFSSDYDHLIAFDWSTFRAENVARAEVRGWEAQAGAEVTRWLRARIAYTLTDTEDLATGRALARRPRHKVAATLLATAPGAWSGSVTWLQVRERFESDGTPMDSYSRLDAAAQLPLLAWLEATVRVENALDEDYEELPGYTSPGRTIAFGLVLRMGRK